MGRRGGGGQREDGPACFQGAASHIPFFCFYSPALDKTSVGSGHRDSHTQKGGKPSICAKTRATSQEVTGQATAGATWERRLRKSQWLCPQIRPRSRVKALLRPALPALPWEVQEEEKQQIRVPSGDRNLYSGMTQPLRPNSQGGPWSWGVMMWGRGNL